MLRGDGITKLGVGNSQRDLLLLLDAIEKRSEAGGDLALNDGSSLLQSCGSTVELLEALQLETIALISMGVGDNKNFAPALRQSCIPLRLLSVGSRRTIDVQVGDTLRSGGFLGDIITLEELLVLSLQQGVTRAGLSKNEKRHGARPRRLDSKKINGKRDRCGVNDKLSRENKR